MVTLEEAARRLDLRAMLITSIITALSFVVGLFWNDAIRSAIEMALPERDTVAAKFITAVTVTVIVVFVAWFLYHTQELTTAYEKKIRKNLERKLLRYKKMNIELRKKLRKKG
jgi:uncharacterized membrane protein